MRWRRRVDSFGGFSFNLLLLLVGVLRLFLSRFEEGILCLCCRDSSIEGTIFVQDKLRRNPNSHSSIRKYHKDMKNLEEIDKRYKDLSRRKVEKRVPNFLELETQKEKEPL
ncbi:uncharacterized protein LOC113277629 [Papaver somniferum]|uniref:uncharacterized protein LOC113277629 n=1 Tax=Papaver somniferum TaxID=3469 RepID=UPI000E7021C6|nr:uncharacterized protein LOC113277629 [Papaver somniferum]